VPIEDRLYTLDYDALLRVVSTVCLLFVLVGYVAVRAIWSLSAPFLRRALGRPIGAVHRCPDCSGDLVHASPVSACLIDHRHDRWRGYPQIPPKRVPLEHDTESAR
jgi:hypothetical protein